MSTFKGRVWKFGDNVNTDMMMPNTARTLSENEQKKCVFESLRPGWSSQVGMTMLGITSSTWGPRSRE